jgi:hypothetical protein
MAILLRETTCCGSVRGHGASSCTALKRAVPAADLAYMEPHEPRMVREEGLSGGSFLAALSLAVSVALAIALLAMASSESTAERVAERLHVASAAEVADAKEEAAAAATRGDVALGYAEHELALLEEQLGLLTEQTSGAMVEAAELRNRLDGLTDVAAIDDLVFQLNQLHARVTALEERIVSGR